jgi:hypothetical protein
LGAQRGSIPLALSPVRRNSKISALRAKPIVIV